jgi:hypothetical protein
LILLNINNLRTVISRYSDVILVKRNFLSVIIQDRPSKLWNFLFNNEFGATPEESFYFWKIWFYDSNTSFRNIIFAKVLHMDELDNYRYLILSYGEKKPEITCSIKLDGDHKHSFFAFFSLNNCSYNPDHNKDNKIDMRDLGFKNIND